jgi:RimJ/RimL family protein N-acetyltransferase
MKKQRNIPKEDLLKMDIIHARCRKITPDDLEKLMNWRMDPNVTRYLNSDPHLTIEGQRQWYRRITEDEKKTPEEGRKGYYWILEVDDIPAGFVSLTDIDYVSKRIHTGAYIAEKVCRSMRLAIDLQWNLYRYSFEELGMHKVCEEVFAENKAVNRLLDICGSSREGVLRDHVCKNGIWYDVVARGILQSEWEDKKKTLEYNRIEMEG